MNDEDPSRDQDTDVDRVARTAREREGVAVNDSETVAVAVCGLRDAVASLESDALIGTVTVGIDLESVTSEEYVRDIVRSTVGADRESDTSAEPVYVNQMDCVVVMDGEARDLDKDEPRRVDCDNEASPDGDAEELGDAPV